MEWKIFFLDHAAQSLAGILSSGSTSIFSDNALFAEEKRDVGRIILELLASRGMLCLALQMWPRAALVTLKFQWKNWKNWCFYAFRNDFLYMSKNLSKQYFFFFYFLKTSPYKIRGKKK